LSQLEAGYSGVEVAQYLGVTTSWVARTVSSGKMVEGRDYD
jgi:hypothetical protein